MPKTLIIKADAAGDVVRTTSLLNIIEGEVFWLTSAWNLPLFPSSSDTLTVSSIEDIPGCFFETTYDLVLNLEESEPIARLACTFRTAKFSGVYFEKGQLTYTHDSSTWYDMSLISRYGSEKANDLKKSNRSSYQEILFRMLGKAFNGEEYRIFQADAFPVTGTPVIGLETHVGKRWPNKSWYGFPSLNKLLSTDGFQTQFFERRADLRDYLRDIRRCDFLVTGDTLAMHIALAYRIPCIGIFNCTSPFEIYDYGILKKLASPLLDKYYYQTTYNKEAVEAISVEEVYKALMQVITYKLAD